jgi:hypothetical protein
MSVLDFFREYAPVTNLISSFLGATIAVFVGGYLRERGRQLAIRHDFEPLREQLAENTTLTKSIESDCLRQIGSDEASLNTDANSSPNCTAHSIDT